jgi:hypothetical protein
VFSTYLPLYMFGETYEIRIFYDSGHCLLKTGVPGELWGCLTKHGPHALGTVGATTVYGGDAWACLPLATGLTHTLSGLTNTPFEPLGHSLHTTTTTSDIPSNAHVGLALV